MALQFNIGGYNYKSPFSSFFLRYRLLEITAGFLGLIVNSFGDTQFNPKRL